MKCNLHKLTHTHTLCKLAEHSRASKCKTEKDLISVNTLISFETFCEDFIEQTLISVGTNTAN